MESLYGEPVQLSDVIWAFPQGLTLIIDPETGVVATSSKS